MDERQILITNIILYAAGVPVFIRRCGLVSLATMAWLLYLVCAICSLLYFESPVYYLSFAAAEYIRADAMLFLLVMNFLLCYMLRLFSFPKADIIHNYREDRCRRIQLVLTVVFAIIALLSLPGALSNLMSGNLGELRDATYEKGASGLGGIMSFVQRLLGACVYLLLIFPAFNFFVRKKLTTLDKVSLAVFLAQMVAIIGMAISRAMMVTVALFVLSLFVMSYHYLNAKTVRWVMLASLPVMFIAVGVFSAITSARFGASDADDTEEQFANIRYAGESMLNYTSMMYDQTYYPTEGYQQFLLFRKGLGMHYFGESKSTDVDILNEYFDDAHPYPNYIFYTAAGNLYMEWGKWPPLIALVIINIIIGVIRRREKRRREPVFNFFWYVLGAYLGYVVIYGIFYLELSNEGGNMMWLILPGLYLMLRGSNMLLDGTPLKPWDSRLGYRLRKSKRSQH
ncbi:MAG: oligosaccharide repeat unit polymerase [bacterium]|nr:oligosaccharide repeat unit polymerase [bacterium]